jgi:hypothetical protein
MGGVGRIGARFLRSLRSVEMTNKSAGSGRPTTAGERDESRKWKVESIKKTAWAKSPSYKINPGVGRKNGNGGWTRGGMGGIIIITNIARP